MKKILICYYSESRSTEEVCYNIGDTFKAVYDVTIQPIKMINNIDAYETIIIAAPVHGMNWHMNAFNFVVEFKAKLIHKEVVYIALASMAYQGREFWQKKVYKSLEKPSKIVSPIETAIFGGLIGDMPTFFNFLFGISSNVKRDQRDWEMIEAWKINLMKKLKKS